ncbi:hypothetical protein E2I14_04575 [Sapientia aquatica]|uniref:Bacteriocin-protection protein n=1 Tax=Sapientia aquatica TaxID=1549640 RepID=A0A4R5W4B1_9BURK|nr:hypothetical protein E2I14_04575 [Sapientia aquatica]
MAAKTNDRAQVEFKNRAELRAWLKANSSLYAGIWVIYFKKHHQDYLPYDAIAEECLCFGWVDSLPRKLDDDRAMLYISPRKAGSNWSNANKARIEKLIRQELMTKAGMKKVEDAKLDGSWDALVEIQAGVIPKDLNLALNANRVAKRNFDLFPPSSKRIILEWIAGAKTPETRSKRIYETVSNAAENIRANHYRQPTRAE